MPPENHPVLIDPSLDLEDAYIAFVNELWRTGEADSRVIIPVGGFGAFVEKLSAEARGEKLATGWVPENTYWLVADGNILGESHLRHHLTRMLDEIGGHIGYRIRPSARQLGYGTLILGLTIQKARTHALPRLLLTCDTQNIASARIIEKNGGVLRDRFYYEPRGVEISRYWIDLTAPSSPQSIPLPNSKAVAPHRASYPEALLLKKGEEVLLGKREAQSPGWVWSTNKAGESGWIPERWLEVNGKTALTLRDYSSSELTLEPGEELTLHLEESGWCWVTNRIGQSGWIPKQTVKFRDEEWPI